MRNMKRSILLALALIGASVLFLGAAPGTASAGNCSIGLTNGGPPGTGPIWYAGGSWLWQPSALACTDINAVQYKNWYVGAPGTPPFLYDATHGAYHFPYIDSGGGNNDGCYAGPTGNINACSMIYYNHTWGSGCGAAAFYVQPWWSYRLRSKAPPGAGTWGPWHTAGGSSYLIC